MTLSAEQINEALIGFTDVIELSLQTDLGTGAYDLRLVLMNAMGKSTVLKCRDVSNLRMCEFGGGLTQFLALRAEDMRAQQLDRVAFSFEERERGAIAFACASVDVVN